MDISKLYSQNYAAARRRFRDLSLAANARLEQYPINIEGREHNSLTIDVAIIGCPDPSWSLVLSSGTHGIEGFFGSAIQCAWLEQVAASVFTPENGNIVLIHGVNPYGFDALRRTNEHNVDLNRNFLMSNEDYHGAPDGYETLNEFLNPSSPPSSFEPFLLKTLWKLWRMGLPALKNSIAGGQYEFPRGLFFGGHGLEQSTFIIQNGIERWIVGVRDIIHIDFHSGLGQYGKYKLLLVESNNSSEIEWYRDTFGAEYVEPLANAEGTAYDASGIMGDWIVRRLRERNYRFMGAEFGTYSIICVFRALRAENRAHFFCSSSETKYKRAKEELLECFCPTSNRWREIVLERGLGLIEQAIGGNS
ncbi:MAG: DUF2817 domain-containing protein [Cyanobacteria bacterium P01_G01_bin.67]